MSEIDMSCDVCGRRLRSPASRARGRGPVCDAKMGAPLVHLTGTPAAAVDVPEQLPLDGMAAGRSG